MKVNYVVYKNHRIGVETGVFEVWRGKQLVATGFSVLQENLILRVKTLIDRSFETSGLAYIKTLPPATMNKAADFRKE